MQRLDGNCFEGWAYENGRLRQAMLWVRQGFLERGSGPTGLQDFRLTEGGRQHAVGGRDPEARWSRVWDGQCRNALSLDPLLPSVLLPADYLRQVAWQRRREVLAEAGRQLQAFCLSDRRG